MMASCKRVLDFIDAWDQPWNPSAREISEGAGVGLGSVPAHLEVLAEMGLINYERGIARSVTRTEKEYTE